MADDPNFISPEQLCLGLFVYVDLPWMDHPFPFNRFKIKTPDQIETLKQLGVERFRFDPGKSDCAPLAEPDLVVPAAAPAPAPKPIAVPDPVERAQMAEKRARIEQLNRFRQEIDVVEKGFVKAADTLKSITRNLHSRPAEAFEEADALVSTLVSTALAEGDVKIHAMSQQLGEDVYFHSLNVAVLAMVIGNAIHLKKDELHQLGVGALFHDIGQIEIPDAILNKREPLNKPEQALFETHCRHGVRIAGKLGLSAPAQSIVAQHHEMVDGSGYPEKLKGNEISLFARIVAITNAYDKLCNPTNVALALTPAEALSQLFAVQRAKFDDGILRTLIRTLGVYPPGSLVQLSNDMLGLVLSVNPKQPLKPNVMVYDADVPKEAALIVNLESDPALKIVKAIRASLVPREVLHYLNPRQRVTYYFDRQTGKKSS